MKRALFIAFTLAWASACGYGAESERDSLAVQHTVLRYGQLLARGYANMNMTNLQEVATKEQALKAYRHMSALGDAKIRMEPHLENIEFLDTRLRRKDFAQAKTREEWNYTHVNLNMPRQSVVKGVVYNLEYELVKKFDRWIVSSVSILEEERPENVSKGHVPHSVEE